MSMKMMSRHHQFMDCEQVRQAALTSPKRKAMFQEQVESEGRVITLHLQLAYNYSHERGQEGQNTLASNRRTTCEDIVIT